MTCRCKQRCAAAAPLVWALMAASAQAAQYYVSPAGSNAGAGSSAEPWLTLQHAADRVAPGDTVHVLAGQYAGFDLRTGGTAPAPITFLARSGATIDAPNPVTGRDGINIEEASYVTIDGFTLVGSGDPASTRAGIRVVGNGAGGPGTFTTGVIIRNNRADRWGTWGIFTGFANDILIENNQTSRSASQHGIYFSNSADRPVIRGNIVWGNAASGIQLNADLFTGNTSLPEVDGIISGAIVERNVIYDNGDGSAFTAGGGSAINADGVSDSLFRNNLLYDNHASGIALFQIDGGAPSTDNTIVNNTIINADDGRWNLLINSASTGNTVFNNILFNRRAGRGSIDITPDSLPGFRSDYNFLDPRLALDDSPRSLAQWRDETGNDLNSTPLTLAQLQALFVDYAGKDFALAQDSAARDAGVEALLNGILRPAPSEDIEGEARPAGGGWDVGHDELLVLVADANLDGLVDHADFAILVDHFGEAGGFTSGDFDRDGRVTFADFQILERAFGARAGSDAAAAAVPEPAGTPLAMLALLLASRRRRSASMGAWGKPPHPTCDRP